MNDGPAIIHDGTLRCPACEFDTGTHVDGVYALVRSTEDAEPEYLFLGPDGLLSMMEPGDHPDAFGDTGRRHEFVLAGWCELCGETWAIAFRQHEGQTLVRQWRGVLTWPG